MRARRRPVRGVAAALALVVAGAAGAACAPRRVAEAVALGGTVRRVEGLSYGAGARRTLDVYHARVAPAKAPVVVFIYGGRWKYGGRRDYLLVGNALARQGWVAVVPDYRLHPAAYFPDWVEDAAAAVRWAREHAAEFGGDPDRLFVVGHSAGAHTAALLALDARWLREAGVPPGAISGVASLAGPVDTTWTARDVQRLMGPREGWPATYPSTHVEAGAAAAPPLLLLHGGADDVVTTGNSVRLARQVAANGGCARAIVYPGVDHVGIVVALGLPGWVPAPVLDDVAAFVRAPMAVACPGR